MAASLPSPQPSLTARRSEPVAALQLVQGGYYVFSGLAIAFGLEWLQGPADRPMFGGHMWPVRVIALLVVALGVSLLRSGRNDITLPMWVGMGAALFLMVLTSVAMAIGVLSMTFLLDAAMEGLFFVCWLVLGASRAESGVRRSTPLPP